MLKKSSSLKGYTMDAIQNGHFQIKHFIFTQNNTITKQQQLVFQEEPFGILRSQLKID